MSMTESGYQDREQSEIKHHAIRLYLEAAARIVGSAFDIKYVDCCAGPWNSRDSEYRDTSFGIAFDVLKASHAELAKRGRVLSIDCLFIEKEPDHFRLLDAFAKKQTSLGIKVRAENWDFVERIDDIVHYCSPRGAFPFILIDPWGWKLAGISQISPLLKLKPGEVVINLMSSFITRFVNDPATDLSDLLGEDFPELRKLSGTELEFAVVRKYCDLIKREGKFSYVCALPVMKPDTDAFNFYLIYATRHPKGVEVFKQVEKRTEELTHLVRADVQRRQRQEKTGNFELFDSQVLYRERKYQQLAEENRVRAKKRVWQLLAESDSVSYDDCWAEALQFPAVYQSDLREWLTEWEKDGKLQVKGRKKPTEVLKRSYGHSLALPGKSR
ncbi:MAG: three-Cys-motif partner protein TcmP [Acidobacteriota bacterium]|nr:three-Cys-motif partner protein TcmP [Acidobacteriota bacterium]